MRILNFSQPIGSEDALETPIPVASVGSKGSLMEDCAPDL